MRRADRLFQLVQILRNKRLVTARILAQRLEVSERTIYRDIQDLSISGLPVQGEAGVGYHLRYSLDIPPLMFTTAEIEALVVGARMLKAWGGSELGSSAQSVLDKIHAVIPAELHCHLQESRLFVMRFGVREDIETTLDLCRHAIAERHLLRMKYQRADQEYSQRDVKPVGLFFWGRVWTLTAWCELRNSFRTFRLDRIHQLEKLSQTFEELPGQRLADFVAIMQAQCDQ